jgi:hypothetical protein
VSDCGSRGGEGVEEENWLRDTKVPNHTQDRQPDPEMNDDEDPRITEGTEEYVEARIMICPFHIDGR